MDYPAKKIVIITEKIITDKVTRLVEECGATGYTLSSAGGKGSRDMRSTDRDAMSDTKANIKIEIIVVDSSIADKIATAVTEKLFKNYSGIIFLEDVKILRPEKF